MNVLRSLSPLALACAAVCAHAQSLVTNGSFETGDFTGWTLDANPLNTGVVNAFASDGDYSASLGEIGRVGSLTQTISTVAGASYTFSFDFAGGGDVPSFFSAAFGGNTLFSVTNPPFDDLYLPYSFTVQATSASTDVVFSFRDDPFYVFLDNVQVTPARVSSVPGPLAALPFAALALRRRKRS